MTPRDGSLTDRLITHLRRHPGLELTGRQIAEQFSYKRGAVYARVAVAVRAGLVEWIGGKRPHRIRLAHPK